MNLMTKMRLWEVRQSSKAYLFSTAPQDRDGRQVWIPRSVVCHVSRGPKRGPDVWTECIVTLEDWFVAKEGL